MTWVFFFKYFGYVKHKISVFSSEKQRDEGRGEKKGVRDKKEKKRNKRKIQKSKVGWGRECGARGMKYNNAYCVMLDIVIRNLASIVCQTGQMLGKKDEKRGKEKVSLTVADGVIRT